MALLIISLPGQFVYMGSYLGGGSPSHFLDRSLRRNQRVAHSVCLGAPDGQGPDLWGQGEREVFCKNQSHWDPLSTADIFKTGQSIILIVG